MDQQEGAELYTSADAARHAGVAYRTLMRWAEQGLVALNRPEGRQKPPLRWSYGNVCEAYVIGQLGANGLSLETIGAIMMQLRGSETNVFRADHFLHLRKTGATTATVAVIGSERAALAMIRAGEKVIGTVPPGLSSVAAPAALSTPQMAVLAPSRQRSFPWPLHGAGVAELGGRLWVVGGKVARSHWDHVTYDSLVVYDPIGDTWTQAAPLPTPRAHVAVVSVGGKLYAAGGQAQVGEFAVDYNCIHVYDPAVNEWADGPKLPHGFVASSSALHEGEIWLGSGKPTGGGRIVIVDPRGGAWRHAPELPEPHVNGAIISANGHIWMVGGATGGKGEVLRYDLRAGWTVQTVIPDACETAAITTDGRRIFIVAGLRRWYELRSRVDVFDAQTGDWSQAPDLPGHGRMWHSCAVLGRHLYSVVGETGPYQSDNRVFRLDISRSLRHAAWEELGA